MHSKTTPILLAGAIVPLTVMCYFFLSSWETRVVRRQAIDLWDKTMIQGTGGIYADGKPKMDPSPNLKEFGATAFDAANNSKSGIIVGRKINILLGGGGWVVQGGLFAKVE